MSKNVDIGYALTLPQSRLLFGQAGHKKGGQAPGDVEYSNSWDGLEIPRKKNHFKKRPHIGWTA